MLIAFTTLEAVKGNLVEIIGSRIAVHKAGANWKARCPFHDDENPSLTISERRRMWRCWVCNEGGDTLDFVQKFHNVDFIGALAILGIVPDASPENRIRSERIMRALDEIRRDEADLLADLAKREDELCAFSRNVGRILYGTPPLEREARYYMAERSADFKFEELENERRRIQEIAARKRREVLEWK